MQTILGVSGALQMGSAESSCCLLLVCEEEARQRALGKLLTVVGFLKLLEELESLEFD